MFLKYSMNMIFLWLYLLGTASSAPSDEFRSFVHEGELEVTDDAYIKYIIPSGYSPHKIQKQTRLLLRDFVNKDDLFFQDNEYYKILNEHVEAGHTMKGLTFNIYDDNMREATIALFRLLQFAQDDKIESIKEWASANINNDMLDYALILTSLFRVDALKGHEPPFITKPNYFVNSETIKKAFKLKLNNGKFNPQEAQVQQFYRTNDVISINTNYSSWNLWNKECRDNLDYFREDIGLNSYYYGVHFLYPFWMNSEELTGTDPKYAEKYYYIHQQLMARYNLEKEHLKYLNVSDTTKCYDDYMPYLTYDNGLPFPSRSNIRREWSDDYARIKSVDIAIKECITRGVIFMENGTKIDLTEDNFVDLLAKLIRANFESVQVAKTLRSLFGYGSDGYPTDRYNPAPSVLHHPQTSLRDPIYWYMIQSLLKYFDDFSNTLDPYDFSKYQNDEFSIIDNSFTKITTYYEFYQFNLEKIFSNDNNDLRSSPLTFTARQKRLKHTPFSLSFTIDSKYNKTSLVKLFLGPACNEITCFDEFSKFFELDSFIYEVNEGLNILKWSPETTLKYAFDDYFNIELKSSRKNKFCLFKFPENMIIPKGLEQGLNFTLFILITPVDDDSDLDTLSVPLGFPFHRQTSISNFADFNNYKFYNVTIYHKENSKHANGYFSSHLN
ncbi:arylphorin subunit alpha-like isoform X1 [Vanessa atalanta]|uniref:arylphorin subunit alpha-like isoform X1 n=1 Tax=Vanessa atalanta TaxID=42275 RepID=UPI001FCDBE24|nr:arylphorin subunit alpha-like isoform X1 [Vanessa atalanta]